MSRKNPDIATALRRHPAVRSRRSPARICIGVIAAALVMLFWLYIVLNAQELREEFAATGGVTLNQRIGSHFGVLIGILGLPPLALIAFLSFFLTSRIFFLAATGTRLLRTYHGAFAATIEQAQSFYDRLRTRDRDQIGTLHELPRGNCMVQGWSADADRVAFVCLSREKTRGVDWPAVEFAGADYDVYREAFADHYRTPGGEVREAFRQVRRES